MSALMTTPAAAGPEPATGAPTPYLTLDVGAAVARCAALREALPGAGIHYAVKANPDPTLLAALARTGSRFDVASPAEVDLALAAGAVPQELVYSNPVKARADVVAAHASGVRLFVADSVPEIDKLAEAAPGSSVLCRLLTSGAGSAWPLSRKYGVSAAEAVHLLVFAAAAGLDPAGVSFHVGSQQGDPHAWRGPVRDAARVFQALRLRGLRPWLLDLGGGFPAALAGPVPPLSAYGRAIESALRRSFGDGRPEVIVEPGRGIVADAGTLTTSVIGVVERGGRRWVFLDAGVFTGLVETLDEAIRYRLRTEVSGPTGPCVLAGPTCDSADVLYERQPVQLPLALREGDRVVVEAAGAYTSCYSTVGFNGFAPLRTEVVGVG
ncbi:MAG: type III PLP-dependent enzyme [Nocardioidaceae bacterium]